MVKLPVVNKWSDKDIQTLRDPITNAEAAKRLGRSVDSVQKKRKRLGIAAYPKTDNASTGATPKQHVTVDMAETNGAVSSLHKDIRSVDELLDYAKVDRQVWEVERHTINRWEVVMREPATTVGGAGHDAVISVGRHGEKSTLWTRASNKPMHEPLYQIKVWLKRRVIVERTREIIKEMLQEFRREAPRRALPVKHNDGALLEISIFDLHLGKLCWGPESGKNYDVKLAQAAFTTALESLLHRAKGFDIGRILFPVGNDFFNVDNNAQTTTAGTPQHEDVRWQKSFVSGRKLMVDAILRLREIAPVDVVMVSGNHDMQRVFYLGEVLSGWFSRTAGVTINNAPTTRKYYQFGKNMIAFTHGKDEKHSNLPLLIATEQPHMWASTLYREIHLGHFHHKKEIHFQPVDEFNGVRVRIIPSLCPADAWHKLKGYEGLRAAEAFVWDKDGGCIGTFSFSN